MCSLSNLGLFWFLEVSMCSREDLQAQKCSFWMISVEFDNLLPAELPLTAENHWFSFRFDPGQPIDPTRGNQLILHWKFMFFRGKSALNIFWTLLRPGNRPHGGPNVSETIWYHGGGWDRRNLKFENLLFFISAFVFYKKKQKRTHHSVVL